MKNVINVYMLLNKETNQNTGAIQKQTSTEDKKQDIILNAVVKSGDLKAAYALWDLIVEKTELQSKNKSLQQLIKQIEAGIILTIIGVFVCHYPLFN